MPEPPNGLPELLDLEQLVAELVKLPLFRAKGVTKTRRWVYRAVADRGLPAYRDGGDRGRPYFELPQVRAWLERRKVGEWAA
jgi:hypothetical protein